MYLPNSLWLNIELIDRKTGVTRDALAASKMQVEKNTLEVEKLPKIMMICDN
jgi:hypothetical protein